MFRSGLWSVFQRFAVMLKISVMSVFPNCQEPLVISLSLGREEKENRISRYAFIVEIQVKLWYHDFCCL